MRRINSIELRLIHLPLLSPFRTSFDVMREKACIVVRVVTDDGAGWGECVADAAPGFSEEFNDGVWLVLRDLLGPALLSMRECSLDSVEAAFRRVRGHPMAKAALIDAVLDAQLRADGRSLAEYLGGAAERVAVGISLGITETIGELLDEVARRLDEGYRRIKLKIAPGIDVDRVAAVRAAHPGIALSVDANAAYTLSDAMVFRTLDEFRLLMIEQPLHHDDLLDHAKLQREIRTPICLDESIRSAAAVAAALELGACQVVNIKQGRVGGILEARRIHDLCRKQGVPVWCGGMLETGIGRATNLALASLPGFTLPGDISPSSRYFEGDLTPSIEMAPDGTALVPVGPGIGIDPLPERLAATTQRIETITGEER